MSSLKNLVHVSLPGMVVMFSGSLPDGWLYCDGSTLSVSEFPNLFANIGYMYGGSGGSFKLPDYRGQFMKGTSPSRTVGTYEAGQDQGLVFKTGGSDGGKREIDNSTSTSYIGHSATGRSTPHTVAVYIRRFRSNNEVRPDNIAVNYCIKY